MTYLTLPAARFRLGLSVQARHLPEGRLLVTSMLQPSVKARAIPETQPVDFRQEWVGKPAADHWDDVAGWALLAAAVVVGFMAGVAWP